MTMREIERIEKEMAAVDALIAADPYNPRMKEMRRCLKERRDYYASQEAEWEQTDEVRKAAERLEKKLWDEGDLWYKIQNASKSWWVVLIGSTLLLIQTGIALILLGQPLLPHLWEWVVMILLFLLSAGMVMEIGSRQALRRKKACGEEGKR